MNIVLLHYHLRPGGVTTVLLRQARALRDAGDRVLIVSGEGVCGNGVPANGLDRTGVKVLPGLHYDHCRRDDRLDGTGLLDSLQKTFSDFRADLAVVHNPLIRKNSLLSGVLQELARRGQPLLLQNHDLAEDSRPDVYSGGEYPENCHYAVINSRDYRFLLEAGLVREGLHLIPNEVCPLTAAEGLERRRYLYPVRGIRRKNLGEALLLSLFIPEGRCVSISLPPTTSRGEAAYLRWKSLAAELRLPVEFEAGSGKDFSELLGSAFAVITTSIKEGFGFSFLEPWTAGLAVTGRRIEYVCADFEKEGVRFTGFYRLLALPRCAATKEYPRRFRAKLEQAVSGLCAAFGMTETPEIGPERLPEFGEMDEELQEDALRRAAGDQGFRAALAEHNPFLKNLDAWTPDPAIIRENRAAVLAAYSQEKIAGLLRESCLKTLKPVVQSISRKKLLERFLEPSRLYLTGIDHEPPRTRRASE